MTIQYIKDEEGKDQYVVIPYSDYFRMRPALLEYDDASAGAGNVTALARTDQRPHLRRLTTLPAVRQRRIACERTTAIVIGVSDLG